MKAKLLYLVRNPLIIVPLLVLVLGFGWQQYTYAGRDLSLPDGNSNLLPNGDFSNFTGSLPAGWQLVQTGNANYQTAKTDGYAAGSSLQVTVDHYQSGDLALTSPKVAVQPGKTYLFKGYYKTDTTFALVVRYYYADGSSKLQFVQNYPGDTDDWSTTSDAFKAAANTVAVQFVYRMYSNGTMQLNSLYLEPQQNIYIAPAASGTNTLPNAQLAADANDMPKDWSAYRSGNNTATFLYNQDPDGPYIQTQASDYVDGQAKWQYPAQSVKPGQYYQLGVDYESDVPVPIVAEYVMQDGSRLDQTIATIQPADTWTTTTTQLEVPPQATNLFVSLPLQHSGTVSTRNYQLINTTKPGTTHWHEPLVSITFDDGWQLAYDNAVPVLQQYGYPATFYINPSSIETPNFMTASELTTLSKDGDEIAAHGYEHDDLTAINNSALDYQLREGRNYLQAAGYKITDVATPYGRSDSQVQWYARRYYATLRGTSTGINTRQNLDPYNLKVFYISDQTTPASITAALQATKASDGWLIFVYHQVGDELPPYGQLHVEKSATPTATFKQQMSLVHNSDIKVLPVATAYANIKQQ